MDCRRRIIAGSILAALTCAVFPVTLLSAEPQAPNRRDDRPNVLIILTDQQQGFMLSAHDASRVSTPAMDSIARRGVRFTHAFCVTPQCSPSRAALLTGRWPHEVNMMGNLGNPSPPLDRSIPTAGSILSAAGYDTAYLGKWHLGTDPAACGFAIARTSLRGEPLAKAAADYLRTVGTKPFFALVSFVNPHDVYDHPRRGRRKYDTGGMTLPSNFADDLSKKPWPQRHFLEADQGKRLAGFEPADWLQYLAHYRAMTEKVDREIGTILAALRASKLEENTLLIFSSDHGDLAGAHGLPYKCPAMYEELVRVPLIISWPRRFDGDRTAGELVSLIDVLPTICDLTAVDPPKALRGLSLARSLAGVIQGHRDTVFAEYYGKQKWVAPIRTIRTRRWKYNLYRRHGEELYDLLRDPGELRNLADDEKHGPIKTRLRNRLEAHVRNTNDPFFDLPVTDRAGRPLKTRDKK